MFAQNISSASGSIVQGFVTEDGYVLPGPPSVGLPGSGIWRDQSTLVMSKDAVLPQRCVKCNVQTTGRLTRKLSWHPPALFVLLVLAWLIYLIVVMIVRKTATVEVGLCDEHRAKRRAFIWITVAMALLGLGGFVLAIAAEDAIPALLGALLLLGSIIFGVIATRVTYPAKIDDRFVWLKGINADYVAQFPPWPGF